MADMETQRLVTSGRVENPSLVRVEITLTMDVADWEKLVVQMGGAKDATAFPASWIREHIHDTVRALRAKVGPEEGSGATRPGDEGF